MLYQKLLMGERPYFVNLSRSKSSKGFEEHRHTELELYYCMEGTRDFIVNKEVYKLHEGDLLIIGSMQPHELIQQKNNACSSLVIDVGPALLGRYFEPLSRISFTEPVLHLNTEKHHKLMDLILETGEAAEHPSDFSELTIKGNLYKICAYILKEFIALNAQPNSSKALRSVSNVEKALEHIYANYKKPLQVEDVAILCGYSKSNFCKIFKNITGETFHNVLNQYRLKIAGQLLRETNQSLDEISLQTGFTDAKTLCRIFKKHWGITPGTYRNNKKS